MTDSWMASKLEPGLAAAYSTPRSRITWIIRSDAGRVILRTSTGGRTLPASRKSWASVGGGAAVEPALGAWAVLVGAWASACCPDVTSAAAPAAPAAAFFRKPRRPTEVFFSMESLDDFAMVYCARWPSYQCWERRFEEPWLRG